MLTLRATLGERVGCRDGVAPVFGGIRSDRNVPGRSRRRAGRGREPVRDYLVRHHIDRLIDDVTTSNLEGAGEVLGTDRPE